MSGERSEEETAAAWAASEEGKAAIERAMREAAELTKRLEVATRVDWRTLQEPMTI